MQQRPEDIALLRAILLENCGSDEAAAQHLLECRRLGIDPLDYCAHRFGLGNALTWQRAAHWAGFGFFPSIPRGAPIEDVSPDLDRLGEMRTIRQSVLGRDIVFGAPRFDALLKLRATRRERPDFARKLCVVPPEALESALAARHSTAMMDEARQKLTRLWRGVTAATGLSRSARIGFAVALIALIVVVMVAGAINRPLLVPVVAAMLIGPGLMRLAASFPGRPKPAPRLLADWELSTYTVLIPLRDEAAMVPMLRRAMSALDYPALCIKRTKH